ncbi:hypothetical protein MN116_001335 [Schistosoma mekongi]|uniref:BTB domain-containing protein n=1 Tax=Schistosoma mekongi TaxID=38744 RepID=A0AAE1ZLJ0_SCHME|nr:hypothetical protein MN116_001335 [Schistosoma mekongi]
MEIACNNNHNNSSTTNSSNTIFINSNINAPANVTSTILSSDCTVAIDDPESENSENVNRSRKQRFKTTRSHLLKSKTICKALHGFLGHNLHLKQSTYSQKCLSGSNNQLNSVDHISINRNDSVTDFLETPASIPAFLRARKYYSRVVLNVGGERHEVMWKTLRRLPLSRLGRLSISDNPIELAQLFDDYSTEKNELYFDRYARSFGSILGVYRTGHLHFFEDICVVAFKNDLFYWGINEYQLETCCYYKYYLKKEQMQEELKKTREINLSQAQEEQFGIGRWATLQKYIWDIVEKPQTSMAARIFAVISIAFIILSIIGLNLSTIPELRGNVSGINYDNHTTNNTDYVNEHLEMLESICTIWFTFEYALRLLVAPNKCTFIKSPMNLIDVIAILPYYFSVIFEVWLHSPLDSLVSMRKIVQMFRILRILRVFKLARHSQGLQALGYTLKQSYKELGLLMLFVVLVVLLFSSLAYFAEKDDNKHEFQSIPATFWWAIITMTTVGYGDITPKTVLGKVIGSICCICGVLIVGLPIPIIVNNFAAFYHDQMRREKVLKRQEAHSEGCNLGNTDFLRKSSTKQGPSCNKRCPNMIRNRYSLGEIRTKSIINLGYYTEYDSYYDKMTTEGKIRFENDKICTINTNDKIVKHRQVSRSVNDVRSMEYEEYNL